MATFIMPIMMIAMPLIAVGAEFYARKKARSYIEEGTGFYWMGGNDYQQRGLNYMSPTPTERAAWYANSDRNVFGFTKVPFIGIGVLVGLVILSAVHMLLPPLLFASPIIAMAIPAGFAALASVSLLVSGIYMYVNRNKQIDDRYRLEFNRAQIEPNLYLDEDMAYVQELIKNYTQQGSDVILDSSVDTAIDRASTDPNQTVVNIPKDSHQEEGIDIANESVLFKI